MDVNGRDEVVAGKGAVKLRHAVFIGRLYAALERILQGFGGLLSRTCWGPALGPLYTPATFTLVPMYNVVDGDVLISQQNS